MANIIGIAYNPTFLDIPQTENYNDIVISYLDNNLSEDYGGLKWWSSPDLDLRYIIAHSVPSGNQPTPIEGVTAYVGFWGSEDKTDESFLFMVNNIPARDGYDPFVDAQSAKEWLNNSGYWTSYGFDPTQVFSTRTSEILCKEYLRCDGNQDQMLLLPDDNYGNVIKWIDGNCYQTNGRTRLSTTYQLPVESFENCIECESNCDFGVSIESVVCEIISSVQIITPTPTPNVVETKSSDDLTHSIQCESKELLLNGENITYNGVNMSGTVQGVFQTFNNATGPSGTCNITAFTDTRLGITPNPEWNPLNQNDDVNSHLYGNFIVDLTFDSPTYEIDLTHYNLSNIDLKNPYESFNVVVEFTTNANELPSVSVSNSCETTIDGNLVSFGGYLSTDVIDEYLESVGNPTSQPTFNGSFLSNGILRVQSSTPFTQLRIESLNINGDFFTESYFGLCENPSCEKPLDASVSFGVNCELGATVDHTYYRTNLISCCDLQQVTPTPSPTPYVNPEIVECLQKIKIEAIYMHEADDIDVINQINGGILPEYNLPYNYVVGSHTCIRAFSELYGNNTYIGDINLNNMTNNTVICEIYTDYSGELITVDQNNQFGGSNTWGSLGGSPWHRYSYNEISYSQAVEIAQNNLTNPNEITIDLRYAIDTYIGVDDVCAYMDAEGNPQATLSAHQDQTWIRVLRENEDGTFELLYNGTPNDNIATIEICDVVIDENGGGDTGGGDTGGDGTDNLEEITLTLGFNNVSPSVGDVITINNECYEISQLQYLTGTIENVDLIVDTLFSGKNFRDPCVECIKSYPCDEELTLNYTLRTCCDDVSQDQIIMSYNGDQDLILINTTGIIHNDICYKVIGIVPNTIIPDVNVSQNEIIQNICDLLYCCNPEVSSTPTPTPTPTPSVSCVPSCENCGPDYYMGIDGICYSVLEVTDAIPPINPYQLTPVTFSTYSSYYSRFYDEGFNIDGTGLNYQNVHTHNLWKNTNSMPLIGPLNRSAIWVENSEDDYGNDLPLNTWLGFSVCIDITEEKTYYVGMAADNHFRMTIDDVEFVNTYLNENAWTSSNQYSFKIWHVYPVTLPAGSHKIEMFGLNKGLKAGFGCEVYDNTLEELINANSLDDINVLFNSRQDEIEIVQDLDGNNLTEGWSCEGDGIYNPCDNTCTYLTSCEPEPCPDPTGTRINVFRACCENIYPSQINVLNSADLSSFTNPGIMYNGNCYEYTGQISYGNVDLTIEYTDIVNKICESCCEDPITPTPTPTPSVSCVPSCEDCGPDYYLGEDGLCYTTIITDANPPVNPYTLTPITYPTYSEYYSRFYDEGFNIDGTGLNYQNIHTHDVWKNTYSNGIHGPLNRSGIWQQGSNSLPLNTWLGFSVCIDITEEKTYYVGMAADNHFRMVINDIEFVNTHLNQSAWTESNMYSFKIWHVYPVTLPAGTHKIEMFGLNLGMVGSFGCEVYDNTLDELINAITLSDINVLFNSRQDEIEIVQDLDGNNLTEGWSCDGDGSYNPCDNTCTYIISCEPEPCPEPTPTPTIGPDCEDEYTIRIESIYLYDEEDINILNNNLSTGTPQYTLPQNYGVNFGAAASGKRMYEIFGGGDSWLDVNNTTYIGTALMNNSTFNEVTGADCGEPFGYVICQDYDNIPIIDDNLLYEWLTQSGSTYSRYSEFTLDNDQINEMGYTTNTGFNLRLNIIGSIDYVNEMYPNQLCGCTSQPTGGNYESTYLPQWIRVVKIDSLGNESLLYNDVVNISNGNQGSSGSSGTSGTSIDIEVCEKAIYDCDFISLSEDTKDFNGIDLTVEYQGNAEFINTGAAILCGVDFPQENLVLGDGGSFTLTLSFGSPVNNLSFAFGNSGQIVNGVPDYGNFIFTTDTDPNPTLTEDQSSFCYGNIVDNEVIFGQGLSQSIIDNSGGGVVTVNASTPFTTITIEGSGDPGGTLVQMCQGRGLVWEAVSCCDAETSITVNIEEPDPVKVFVFYDGTSLDTNKAQQASESIREWYQNNVSSGVLESGSLYEGVVGATGKHGENWLWWMTYPYLGSLSGGTLSDGTVVTAFNEGVTFSEYNSDWCQPNNLSNCTPRLTQFNDGNPYGTSSDIYRRINRGYQLSGGYGVSDIRSNGVPFDHDILNGTVDSTYGNFTQTFSNYIVICVADESDGVVGLYHGKRTKPQLSESIDILTNGFGMSPNDPSDYWNQNTSQPSDRFANEYGKFLQVWQDMKLNQGKINGIVYPVIDDNLARIAFPFHCVAAIEGETITPQEFEDKYGTPIDSVGPEELDFSIMEFVNPYDTLTVNQHYQNLNSLYQNGPGLKHFGIQVVPTVDSFSVDLVSEKLDEFIQSTTIENNYGFSLSGVCYSLTEQILSEPTTITIPWEEITQATCDSPDCVCPPITCEDDVVVNEEGAAKLFKFTVQIGNDTGLYGINWHMGGQIPDRFVVYWNGEVVIDTGFVGPSDALSVPTGTYTYDVYDSYTYSSPNMTFGPSTSIEQVVITQSDIQIGSGISDISFFNKDSALPTEMEVWVYSHPTNENTVWTITPVCDIEEPVTPTPTPTPSTSIPDETSSITIRIIPCCELVKSEVASISLEDYSALDSNGLLGTAGIIHNGICYYIPENPIVPPTIPSSFSLDNYDIIRDICEQPECCGEVTPTPTPSRRGPTKYTVNLVNCCTDKKTTANIEFTGQGIMSSVYVIGGECYRITQVSTTYNPSLTTYTLDINSGYPDCEDCERDYPCELEPTTPTNYGAIRVSNCCTGRSNIFNFQSPLNLEINDVVVINGECYRITHFLQIMSTGIIHYISSDDYYGQRDPGDPCFRCIQDHPCYVPEPTPTPTPSLTPCVNCCDGTYGDLILNTVLANVITPCSSYGVNDCWGPKFEPNCPPHWEIKIYNRWGGEMAHIGQHPSAGGIGSGDGGQWCGQVDDIFGNLSYVSAGVYFWVWIVAPPGVNPVELGYGDLPWAHGSITVFC